MGEQEEHDPEDEGGEGGEGGEGADGAAVFPPIPEELGVQPILLALLHSMVFIDGSTEEVIDPEAANEAMEYVLTYLQRLKGPTLERVREDIGCLLDFAKQQGWPKQQQVFLKSFLSDYGIGPKD
jgi:hypothetical protein